MTTTNELIIEMTISHNEVNENFSVMSIPSKMKVAINKLNTWNEVKKYNPNIINIWAQQVWDISHPNTFGKVIDVKILN